MSKLRLSVEGMSCGKCEARVVKAATGVAGVTRAQASHQSSEVVVEYEEGITNAAEIASAITEAGYPATA